MILRHMMEMVKLGAQTLAVLFHPKAWRPSLVLEQLYLMGNKSVGLVVFALAFSGIVVVMEYAFHIRLVLQTAEMVPGFSSSLMMREFGAGITALLLASKIGAGMAAELATMKTTEQVEALRLMRVDPVNYLVMPRFIASSIVTLILSIIGVAVAILGGMLVATTELGVTWESYLSQISTFIQPADGLQMLIKAGIFGMITPIISCYFGLHSQAGAGGVGKATTEAVVYSAIAIIGSDFFLTWFFTTAGRI
ncbi:MAG: ABC transporter permease [Deltaproteobacteria bacterium]|nr:ABC transporter permease [Deltaproteobacteria bacterium]